MMDRAEFIRYIRQLRDVHDPCNRCQGMGVASYGNTSTWRHGIGGQSFTSDVCEICWGSGDKSRPWLNLRILEKSRTDWEEDQCLQYLGRRLGAPISRLGKRIAQLADLCDKQANKRKLPEGEQDFWWHHEWQVLAEVLRKFVKDEEVKSNP